MCFSWQLLHTWQSLIKDPAQGNSVNIIFLYGGNSCISVEILIDNVKCLSLQLSIYSFIEGQLQEIVRKSRYCTAVHKKSIISQKTDSGWYARCITVCGYTWTKSDGVVTTVDVEKSFYIYLTYCLNIT